MARNRIGTVRQVDLARRTALAALGLCTALTAGCTSAVAPISASAPVTSASSGSLVAGVNPQVTTLVTGLTTPWGLAFLPDGSALVTERNSGHIKQVSSTGQVSTIGTVSGVRAAGEGGLLGIAIAPDFATSARIFVYYTADEDNRIATATLDADQLTAQRDIVTGIPKGSNHNGGRLAIGPDGLLYAGTGDGERTENAQDLNSLGGKILRLQLDGSAPADHPFANAPLVYSLGHRNVQGLAFDQAGRLWSSEFGQDTWDELNLIHAGDNDGWPTVEGQSDDQRFVSPVRQWTTDDASPSGIAVVAGSVWMAALKGQRLWQIPLDGASTGTPIPFFGQQYGRLRTVVAAPDGTLWLTTSNTDGRGDPRDGDDRILRVTVSRA